MGLSQSNDDYWPPNTLNKNNAYESKAHDFGNSGNTGFNDGPGRHDTVYRTWEGRYVPLNNSNNASSRNGAPNTINNAYGNQAYGFGNSRSTVFNNGPRRDDTVFRPWVDQSVNSDSNLHGRETGIIEPLQVSTFYFVFRFF